MGLHWALRMSSYGLADAVRFVFIIIVHVMVLWLFPCDWLRGFRIAACVSWLILVTRWYRILCWVRSCSHGLVWAPLDSPRLSWALLGSLDSPGLSWALLGSLGLSWALFWLVWALLDAPVLFWARVGSPGLVWALLGSLGLVWALLGSPGFIRASLGSYGFFHGQCGHTLIMIFEGRHLICVFDGRTDHYAPSTALHECEVSCTA